MARPLRLSLLSLTLMVGCVGTATQDDDGPTQPALPDAAPSPLRRLRRAEYQNTVADVLGLPAPSDVSLPEDARYHYFRTTSGQSLSASEAAKYLDTAAGVASAAGEKLATVLPCPSGDERACIAGFLATTGTRLFRRPLTGDEQGHFLSLFTASRAAGSFEESATLVLEALLTSPGFLFVDAPAGRARLDGYQLATRLATLLWQSAPDEALLAAAAAGQLATPDGLGAQVDRLMADPRAQRSVRSFFREWLALDSLERIGKLTPEQAGMLLEEGTRFTDDVFWNGPGTYEQLLVSPVRFRSRALSAYYGDGLGLGDAMERYEAPPSESSFGLLSQAGLLLAMGPNPDSAIIYRGKFIRTRLLCGALPAPPAGAPPLPELTPGTSGRERIAAHTGGPQCRSCHSLMNPLGFSLEHFDGAGLWRETENGLPIDTRVDLDDPALQGPVDGAHALSVKLAQSPAAHACAVRQMFTFAFGRPPEPADDATLASMSERFSSSGFRLQSLLRAVASSDAFRVRVEPSPVKP